MSSGGGVDRREPREREDERDGIRITAMPEETNPNPSTSREGVIYAKERANTQTQSVQVPIERITSVECSRKKGRAEIIQLVNVAGGIMTRDPTMRKGERKLIPSETLANSRVTSLAACLHEEETRYAAALKACEGFIKKHSPSKEIDSVDVSVPETSSSRPSSLRTTSSESACSATAASGYAAWRASRSKKNESSSTRSVAREGINGESRFEAALLKRVPGCEVWEYDFTVDSFSPEIEHAPNMKERAHFFLCALGGRSAHGPDDSPKYYTLDALRQLNGGPLPIQLHVCDDCAKFDFFHDWWAALEAAILDRGELGVRELQRRRETKTGRVEVGDDDRLALYIP
ncbi:hypothetical protein EDB89DRAFT_1908881 [Lactarius sanguifluus]|nr:hypothetical protein EDB89DRAFT_1908881 [Lactarius sanguifluus]